MSHPQFDTVGERFFWTPRRLWHLAPVLVWLVSRLAAHQPHQNRHP
ncbi:MAG TPA: hypothetical protein VGD98_08170 [Ktedonobacteraceae bacterium]